MNLYKTIPCSVALIFALTACSGTTSDAERNLEQLRTKALKLDSLITLESGRLRMLDSTLADEFIKAGKLDSLITHESNRIDSLLRNLYKRVHQQKEPAK